VSWGRFKHTTNQNKIMKINKIAKILLGAVLLLGAMLPAQAADKVDPSGTYMWTMPGRNGGADRTNTLVLKLDGDKLTGKLSAPGRGGQATETEIADAKLAGAAVSFCVVRSFNGNTMTNKYSGTVAEGSIKGKVEFNRNGDVQSRDWEAKLQK
jgi:opacity protein-like surface antigen